ncbi:Rieske 2Fe-2S domain-containing protein [Amycolatopsis acidiphila]|uniref:Rieske 2Fe-2S domain-containing protein n=1 Tax=Amycolatopsis acidiphila TaxID=715473 RepID=UPI001C938293|nr:Rieske 2Fe-2S domain-containing protein [Amycolatopsis acidiphila]UIJ59771.1 Rieske 2Fe-2S domain-containing protein [Amycolatopsis acidiphila]
MTSPAIHALELERVFAHSWLYVGHESEVRGPGDYVRRPVGGRPVFMVRSVKSGAIRVFHNTCTHRGAVVCRKDSGNQGHGGRVIHRGPPPGTRALPNTRSRSAPMDRSRTGIAPPPLVGDQAMAS